MSEGQGLGVPGISSAGSGVRRRRAAPKIPAPISGEAWGILNPFGDFWTYQTFTSEAWALQYIKDFWAGNKNKPDLATFTPVQVKVTVTAIADTSEGKEIPGDAK